MNSTRQDTRTRTHLNDWVRGTTTYKIMNDGRIFFIAVDCEGYHLFEQADDRFTTQSVHRATFGAEAEARNYADARLVTR